MADRKLMVMNWDGLGDDDDQFFESFDRMSTVLAMDMASSGSDDDEDEDYDDNRMSFASCISAPPEEFRGFTTAAAPSRRISKMSEDYDMWMAEPGSIKERRKKLLQGMGLAGAASIKPGVSLTKVATTEIEQQEQKQIEPSPSPLARTLIVRSRSDGNVASSFMIAQQRMEELLGISSKHHLLRTNSGFSSSRDRKSQLRSPNSVNLTLDRCGRRADASLSSRTFNGKGSRFFVIKNLDTGKEFIVNEFDDEGMWNRVSDLQTGKQLSREEFEKSVGFSPIVKELMRRENVRRDPTLAVTERKASMNLQNLNPIIGRSLRKSKRRGAAWLKNIKGVANSVTGRIGDMDQRSMKNSSQWTKVRQQGKSYKELTGLYMSQEIQAHQGSIWTMRFSFDAHYLASAGEDRVIHVWEVIDCDVMSSASRSPEEGSNTCSTPIHPMASAIVSNQQDRPPLEEAQVMSSEKKRKGKLLSSSKKGAIPDYVMMPDTVFSLSERPVCSFQGHLDDVLDLSWSKSQQLLSSSMDKTVRLWDMESKTCLKLFAHNDYVTCIQFNPIDDSYFISGSLDAKVRLWSIPDRQVVDWTDLHEMVTATCYTPDGQGALVGSHTGTCRLYNTSECKLNQKGQIDLHTKKKTQGKKITGFVFVPTNPSEVLITSADSRIRIFDGSEIVHKFRGFRNTSSQISASFTTDGKYVVSASEDSQIYVWRRDEIKNIGGGKSKKITTRSLEQFHCKDVSVAIPWPGSTKYEPPTVPLLSKRHSKRSILPLLPSSSASSSMLEEYSSMLNNNNRKNLPPLPKNNNILERASSCIDERLTKAPSRLDSGISVSSSFSSDSGYLKYGDSPSSFALGKFSSSSSSSSLSWFDGGNNTGNNCIQATAWGLVVVAAGLGGELRIYQNFGLPVRLSRQSNLFKDHS
ncbi:WD repeat-containing protein 44 [Telopea speciosissima]|uniref:WD repeat-containing protein 44 n=1 Tax=Telopea speciosissima TaxID=54955 RepID=UPI001CC42645|nr:WD repeat-containing protein 44 [Telopea speciosissima]